MHIQILLIIIALVIFAGGVVLNAPRDIQRTENQEKSVLSDEHQNEDSETTDESVAEDTDAGNTPTAGEYISTATPTMEAEDDTTPAFADQVSDFIYPGAKLIESTGNLVMESTDNADKITSWYKERIKSSGMNVTSFVTTKTNGNVLNKLAGANSTKEVLVEITRSADSNTTLIKVSLE